MKNLIRFIKECTILLGFFFMGIIASCAITQPLTRDPVIEPYVDSFVEITNIDKNELKWFTIKFESLDGFELLSGTPDIIGICIPFPVFERIAIDPKFWYSNRATRIRKHALVYHELVHCYCNTMHDNEEMFDGCPVTIMNEVLPSTQCLTTHWQMYMEDMKQRCE